MSNEHMPGDPLGTDARNRVWTTYAGVAVVLLAALALVVLWTPTPESTHTVSNTPPPSNTVQQ